MTRYLKEEKNHTTTKTHHALMDMESNQDTSVFS
ncbi:hypothetical protein MAR_013592 [Mya arenaria]|uniref:Uncharacterized protein n=1 Tax=Mya arenaria TaxID=6604 RepID=A0ABY7G0A8_MYAAR|nr:hypothetical protein MAR_013592 [Mya arenaria]